MSVLVSFCEILVCFFSVFGIYFLVTSIFDRVAFLKAPSQTLLYIKDCDNENIEYLVRFYESRIIRGDFEDMIVGILIKRRGDFCEETLEKLAKEFENIYFED